MKRQKPWHVHKAGPLPVISGVVVSDVSTDGFTLSFSTDIPARGGVQYGTTTALGTDVGLGTLGTSHSVRVDGVDADTLYHYRAIARGHDGTTYGTTASVTTSGVNAPTILSGPTAVDIADTTCRIQWSCDVPCTGQVFYGTTSGGPYPFSSTKESSFTYSAHNQPLSGLTAGTTYYGYIESTNEAGGTIQSAQFSWVTLGAGVTSGIYGSGIGLSQLANTTLGGPFDNNPHSYRFRAEQTANITALRMYFIGNGLSGYSAGTLGTVQFSLQLDDGTGRPAGSDLYAATTIPGSSAHGASVTATGLSWAVTAGVLYHLVIENIDPSPTANYVSTDAYVDLNISATVSPGAATQYHPKYADGDYAVLYARSSTWYERQGYVPILDLTYSNGEHQGDGYMETSYPTTDVTRVGRVNGTSYKVRERIIVSGGNKTVDGVGVRTAKLSGSTGDLTITLQDSGGGTIDTATIAAADIVTHNGDAYGDNAAWDTASFASSQTLTNGNTYYLEFSTTSASTFYLWVARKGISYSYDDATYFADGLAQYTTDGGTTWSSLGRVANQNDVHFYLTLA